MKIFTKVFMKNVMRAYDVDRLYFRIASVEKYEKRMKVVTMQIRVTLHR